MTALARLGRTRTALALLLLARALLLGAAAALVVFLLAALMDLLVGLPLSTRKLAIAFAIVTGVIVAMALTWRARAVLRLSRVALWVEERVPALQYALVTLAERPDPAQDLALVRHVDALAWGPLIGRASLRSIGVPLLILLFALGLLAIIPTGAIARIREPRVGDVLGRPSLVTLRNHLAPIVATITPPEYTREANRVVEDPVGIAALEASRVVIQGPWSQAALVTATLRDSALRVTHDGSRWSVSLFMPEKPGILRLTDGAAHRLITIEPRLDRAPVVKLLLPLRDSVLRAAEGTLQLTADVSDDIGIGRTWFELIVSSGEGESFTFRSRLIGLVGPIPITRAFVLRDSLALGALELKPGDILHLRAIARDANAVKGPSQGSSETRTLRIARPSEYDSVAVEGAPPPDPEEGVLSQRMLIMLTEALEKRRPRLERPTVLTESQAIGRDQKKLRKRVSAIIFARIGDETSSEESNEAEQGNGLTPEQLLAAADSATSAAGGATDFEEGESPVVAINKPLLEAYNFMWEASRELDAGEPARALPPMRGALEAIQRARNAERLYLRGRPPVVIVDLAKVRLQGKERGAPSARQPRTAAPHLNRALGRRLSNALAGLERRDSTVVDSLLVLRVDALEDAPSLAAALAEAIDALRRGRDATAPLIRARRALESSVAALTSTPLWSGW